MGILVGGLNRGFRAIIQELTDDTVRLYERSWILADLKEDRAVRAAEFLKDKFPALDPQPLKMPVQSALPYSRAAGTMVLALDTVSQTLETLAARPAAQPLHFQFAGIGPGGSTAAHLAIQGTICSGDQNTEQEARLLLQTLARMSQAVSSQVISGPAPLTAAVLKTQRQAASHQTALHLAQKERDPSDLSGGPLSVVFGQSIYPLVPVEASAQDTYSQWKALALDSSGRLPSKHFVDQALNGRLSVVALVIAQAPAIHFMRVAHNMTGKRTIVGVTPFAPRLRRASTIESALFTD
jgi:hypothetical protein